MAALRISETLARKLEAIAERWHQSLEEMLESVVDQYPTTDEPLPTHLTHFEDDPCYLAAKRAIAPRLYARARAYCTEVGDQRRLALTDEELDEQFVRFDAEGAPLLK